MKREKPSALFRTSFQRWNSSLHGFGESDVIMKHLMPVARRSAALFMLLGFRCYKKKTDRNLYIFCTNVTELWSKTKWVFRGCCCFHRVYLSQGFWFVLFWWFFFSILFLFLTVSTVVYIRSFVKRKKTCSVVSTLNMSLANKRFNVWKVLNQKLLGFFSWSGGKKKKREKKKMKILAIPWSPSSQSELLAPWLTKLTSYSSYSYSGYSCAVY